MVARSTWGFVVLMFTKCEFLRVSSHSPCTRTAHTHLRQALCICSHCPEAGGACAAWQGTPGHRHAVLGWPLPGGRGASPGLTGLAGVQEQHIPLGRNDRFEVL